MGLDHSDWDWLLVMGLDLVTGLDLVMGLDSSDSAGS